MLFLFASSASLQETTMTLSQNSSSSIGSIPNSKGLPCDCSQPFELAISWSDVNPGRRYYKCEDHGFVVWHDKERSCCSQKNSLLEARDKILTQSEEIKALCAALRQANAQISALEVACSSGSINESLRSIKDRGTEHIKQTQTMLRNVVVYLAVGLLWLLL
ncbi:unnamed protein product [Eruca vesicaria subsp. sativa]|uniref:Zinc finger GRF-type domain-containing protein n=1 Tax=Eruca vesicaria subsp. sativa TaxID=29727 RepID=A0ABC8J2K7_ERUVS|nr:unnamed protein product [Eruca vesicaria subsp. sativa]